MVPLAGWTPVVEIPVLPSPYLHFDPPGVAQIRGGRLVDISVVIEMQSTYEDLPPETHHAESERSLFEQLHDTPEIAVWKRAASWPIKRRGVVSRQAGRRRSSGDIAAKVHTGIRMRRIGKITLLRRLPGAVGRPRSAYAAPGRDCSRWRARTRPREVPDE